MTLLESVDRMVAALGESDLAAAEVALLRRLASLLDENPSASPDVYREYRFAMKAVREALGNDGVVDGELTELLDRLGGAAVRDGADAGT